MLIQIVKNLLRLFSTLNQIVSKLSNHKRTYHDQSFVNVGQTQTRVQLVCRVLLQNRITTFFAKTYNHLNYTVPDVIRHEITT